MSRIERINNLIKIFNNNKGKEINVKYFILFDSSKMVYNINGIVNKTLGDSLIVTNKESIEIVPINNITSYEMIF
jgi:hypothetical protein